MKMEDYLKAEDLVDQLKEVNEALKNIESLNPTKEFTLNTGQVDNEGSSINIDIPPDYVTALLYNLKNYFKDWQGVLEQQFKELGEENG